MLIQLFKSLFAKKTIISASSRIKSGYSAGRSDGSSSGQWYKQ
jgi:hypothetical protein